MKRFSQCAGGAVVIATLLLSGCGSTAYAPVMDVTAQPQAKAGNYRVKAGDTLYSIAWSANLDYRALARANQIGPSYAIHPGQTLHMRAAPRQKIKKNIFAQRKRKVTKKPTVAWSSKPVSGWGWPARGRIVSGFTQKLGGNKGIDIKGRYGEPVRAAAKGVVVYSGDGVRGYGNLIIVKHNASYLSAYAFNKRILIKEGTQVRGGQQIAEMGRDNAGSVMLHFEIRRNGKPVNPLRYLS